MEHRGASETTLSPVPPVLSGADQARFSPQLSWLFLQPNNSHCFTSSAHPASRIGAFPKFMRRQHCGNFSVAYKATRRVSERIVALARSLTQKRTSTRNG